MSKSLEEKFNEWLDNLPGNTEHIDFYSYLNGYKLAQKEMQAKLDEAISVIEFYAGIGVWGTDMPKAQTAIDPCDHEAIEGYGIRGGKRAREFLKKLESEK